MTSANVDITITTSDPDLGERLDGLLGEMFAAEKLTGNVVILRPEEPALPDERYVTASDDDAAEGDAAIAAFDSAWARLASEEWPRLTLDGENVRCPYDGKIVDSQDGLVELDGATRGNPTRWDSVEDEGAQVSQDDATFETLCYKPTCCNRPVLLPEGWDVSWS